MPSRSVPLRLRVRAYDQQILLPLLSLQLPPRLFALYSQPVHLHFAFFVSMGVFISELLPSDLSDFPSAGFAVDMDVVVAAVAVAGVVVTVLA